MISKSLDDFDLHWLPEEGPYRFMADPFGVWQNNQLFIFIETLDYRTDHGQIEVLVLNEKLEVLDRRLVLREPWHLSYPFIFEEDGEMYMLPEAHKSGSLHLYHAVEFPWTWEKVESFRFPESAIDATPVRLPDGWIIIYSPSEKSFRTSALKMARAESLCGYWQVCEGQPFLIDRSGGRMGGTPIWQNGSLLVPLQDCSQTYGGALTIRKFEFHSGNKVRFETVGRFAPTSSFEPTLDGLHTLSEAGPYTLIDAKRIEHSLDRFGWELIPSVALEQWRVHAWI